MSWKEWRDVDSGDLAVVGDPIGHSLSPRMHAAALAESGLDFRYDAVRVPPTEFGEAVEHLASVGLFGLNVTVPLKEAAFALCPGADPRIGAANTLDLRAPRKATNTDAPGFFDTLAAIGAKPCRALVLGAGGSARAVVVALADAGYEVRLHNRTPERAEALAAASGTDVRVMDRPSAEGCGLVVNATSAGLAGEAPEADWEGVEEGALAYDLLYAKTPTPFCLEAMRRGLRTTDGLAMLVAQGARSFTWWFGQPAPKAAMMRALA